MGNSTIHKIYIHRNKITILYLQYDLFAPGRIISYWHGPQTMSVDLLHYACMVSLCVYEEGGFRKQLAAEVLQKLQALAAPDKNMRACRYHGEKLVQLLGKEVAVTQENKEMAKGIFEGGRSSGMGMCYVLRVVSDVS